MYARACLSAADLICRSLYYAFEEWLQSKDTGKWKGNLTQFTSRIVTHTVNLVLKLFHLRCAHALRPNEGQVVNRVLLIALPRILRPPNRYRKWCLPPRTPGFQVSDTILHNVFCYWYQELPSTINRIIPILMIPPMLR